MSKTTKLAVGVLALILLGGGVWYYYSEQDAQGIVPKEWKTYRNDEIGYEFKYPAGSSTWKPLEPVRFGSEVFMGGYLNEFGDIKVDAVAVQDNMDDIGSVYRITVYKNDDMLSAREWATQKVSPALTFLQAKQGEKIKREVREIIVGGVNGILEEISFNDESIYSRVGVIFKKGGFVFEVYTNFDTKDLNKPINGKKIFEWIVDSFRFTK